MSVTPVVLDGSCDPPVLRHSDAGHLGRVMEGLRDRGYKRCSIVMPDREGGGFIAFLYQTVPPDVIPEIEAGIDG
ncbi:MAG TPA: hypothetical protein QF646_01515 [Candidatus Poseidoniales archaeon]|nr:hypothetical protein [Candidatus Poseidoniales archaeon]